MYLSEDGKRFEITRMCPIDSIQFFFSFSANGQRRTFTSKEYQQIYQEQQLSFLVGRERVTEVIECRNNDQSEYYSDVVDEAYVPNIELLPRSPDVSVSGARLRLAYERDKRCYSRRNARWYGRRR